MLRTFCRMSRLPLQILTAKGPTTINVYMMWHHVAFSGAVMGPWAVRVCKRWHQRIINIFNSMYNTWALGACLGALDISRRILNIESLMWAPQRPAGAITYLISSSYARTHLIHILSALSEKSRWSVISLPW